jgi:hypothetical protein
MHGAVITGGLNLDPVELLMEECAGEMGMLAFGGLLLVK